MDRRKRIIEAAEKALIELEKVIKQKIDLSMPKRIKYFDDQSYDMYPVLK